MMVEATYYGWLIFRNGATRTYEVVFAPNLTQNIISPDYFVPWQISNDGGGNPDFFSYNYLGDPNTQTITYSTYSQPSPSASPEPDNVMSLLLGVPNYFPDIFTVASFVKLFPDTAYLSLRQSFWANIQNPIPLNWIQNIQNWCHWYDVDII